jgi:AraC family transcriptional regulator
MSSRESSPQVSLPGSPVSRLYPLGREIGFRLGLRTDPPSLVETAAMRSTIVSIHIGPPAHVSCRRGGLSHHGTAVHGDLDIIPSGMPSLWEMRDRDTILFMAIAPQLLNTAAESLGLEPAQVEIRNRFQVRDPQLENIAWVLKNEMDSGYPCGRLYLDSLATSVAARLVACHSSKSLQPARHNGCLSDRKLRQVLSYIESNLSQDISLQDVAGVAGLSVSHFKGLFRQSVGVPVHQYLVRRRVERATSLLKDSDLSISQVALEAGFAHQSHLAHHVRRFLGVSPKALRENR